MPCLSPVLLNSLVGFLGIVRQFDVMRSARPAKANPPLIVDANRVLLHAIPLQLFQSIRRRLPQVLELLRRIDGDKLLEGAILHIGRDLPNSGAGSALPEICRSGVREAVNHASMKVASSSFPGKGIFTPSVKTRRPPRTRNDAVGWNVPGCPSIAQRPWGLGAARRCGPMRMSAEMPNSSRNRTIMATRWGGRDLADFESVGYPWIFSLLQGVAWSHFGSKAP